MKENNLDAARQSVLNDIQNSYPAFRNMPAFVANQRMLGNTVDPNAAKARLLPGITVQDIIQFHQQRRQETHRPESPRPLRQGGRT